MKPTKDSFCPVCNAPEVNPETGKLFVRAFKVDNASQCLVCSGFYDAETLKETPENHDPNKGWFR